MKPKPISDDDIKVRRSDALFGHHKTPDNGRMGLVMALVDLYHTVELYDENLKDVINNVIIEAKLTARERALFDFEVHNRGV